MKLFKNIYVSLTKFILSYGFFVCIISTILLCLFSPVYYDYVKNDYYSVIRLWSEYDRELFLSDTGFSSCQIMLSGNSGWLALFIPIVSSFAFIPLLCDEKTFNSIRVSIFRSTRIRFYLARFISACLTGGMAIMIGYAIYTGLVYITFPAISEYPQFMQNSYEEMYILPKYSFPVSVDYGRLIIVKLCEVFIYGLVSAVPAIFLTAFINNKYLVLCIPFFIKYALSQTCLKLRLQSYVNPGYNGSWLSRLVSVLDPDSSCYVFNKLQDVNLIIIYNSILVFFALMLYVFFSCRRFDCGE